MHKGGMTTDRPKLVMEKPENHIKSEYEIFPNLKTDFISVSDESGSQDTDNSREEG